MINRIKPSHASIIFALLIMLMGLIFIGVLPACKGSEGKTSEETTLAPVEETSKEGASEIETVTEAETRETGVETKTTEESTGEQGTEEQKITIAVIAPMLDHPWYQRCEDGAIDASKDLGIKVVFNAPQTIDVEEQLSIFSTMVERGVDAILLSTAEPELFNKPISQAISRGVPVFGFDVGAPGTEILFLVSGLEPEATGRMIGEGLAKEIGKKGKVALLTSTLEQKDLRERREAITKVLEEYNGIKILGPYANENDFMNGITQCESVLEANTDLAGFASDMELGVTTACQAVLTKGLAGKVAIWGIGMPKQNSEFVKNGVAKGILTFDPAEMTYIGVMMAYKYLKEGVLPKEGDKFGKIDGVVVKSEDKTVYAPPIQLTPENIDEFGF